MVTSIRALKRGSHVAFDVPLLSVAAITEVLEYSAPRGESSIRSDLRERSTMTVDYVTAGDA
ncbi:hypothetical protein WL76_03240 [Burkholderia ubonensis]|uniref:hypothetical protein n=1 Tax=Burkholderia ubonensis TaxID=101571 RepID=UPI0007522C51|nr:hypothetical protein [Burkholderia ubonensis]KWE61115.1 hypothetical protein WL76_03240 [Burkholderia ubonensis]